MSHISAKNAYKNLEERINRFPTGAPPSKTLYKILELLYTNKEAELIAQLPIRPFNAKTAAKIWKVKDVEAENILQTLAGKALILDVDRNGTSEYIIPPPMAGFFEFALMRTRGDIDQKLLSELYYEYLNVEEDFVKELFLGTQTRLGRIFVQESVLTNDNAVSILDYERASHIIKTASHIGISMCYCRHKMEHMGKACDAPMDICMSLNSTAESLIKHQYARKVDASEGIELLHKAYEHNLVQCGENVREGVNFICNCCGCCCEAMIAAKKYGNLHPVNTTNFLPEVDNNNCAGCGKCVKVCPIEAITLNSEDKNTIIINEEVCLGCGICVRNCPKKCIGLKIRKEKVITPVNSVHRIVSMAIEKGTLQNLIFDNNSFASHRAMASILGAILKLSPIKQAMASKQVKSVYLEKLLSRSKNE